jgi:hypothetical protein
MIVLVTASGARLLEAYHFRSFALQTTLSSTDLAAQAEAAVFTLAGDGHAWVQLAWLRRQPAAADPGWRTQLERMVEQARPYGWISADGRAVRAHVEIVA